MMTRALSLPGRVRGRRAGLWAGATAARDSDQAAGGGLAAAVRAPRQRPWQARRPGVTVTDSDSEALLGALAATFEPDSV